MNGTTDTLVSLYDCSKVFLSKTREKMDSNIKCTNPQIIFNSDIIYLMTVKHCTALYNGSSVRVVCERGLNRMPWQVLYAWKSSITIDNLDSASLVDEDGVRYPLCLAVPCGKCKLCKSQRRYDWETRCMCESATSKYPPLFITLTFDPLFRPKTMEDTKVLFQKFMKRLRINVSRKLGLLDRELRYLAVSEWTPKQHYPHVHMMLWNMPFVPADGQNNPFWALVKFIQEDCWQYGITKVERAKDPSGKYALKYMTKEDNVDCWRLASRRPGIGFQFCMQLLPQVRKNPDLMSFKVPDGRGKLVVRSMPAYFKRLLFPSLSLLFPAKIIKALKDYLDLSRTMSYYYQIFGYTQHYKSLQVCHSVIENKFYQFKLNFSDADPNPDIKLDILWYFNHLDAIRDPLPVQSADDAYYDTLPFPPFSYCPSTYRKIVFVDDRTETRKCLLREYLINSHVMLSKLFRLLDSFEFDPETVQDKLDFKELRNCVLLELSKDFQKYSLDALLHQCDVSDTWEYTHWIAKSAD